MSTEQTKAVLRRWYDEMWAEQNFDLIPELAGPNYVRHEMNGTRTITADEYRDQLNQVGQGWTITDFRYTLVAENDLVTAIGSWKLNGAHWDWVQTFRVEHGKLVETWLSGIGMESNWDTLPS